MQQQQPDTAMFPLLAIAAATPAAAFETWCGKYYEIGSPQTPPAPESRFSYPAEGEQQLLAFKCWTASSIYLPRDEELDPPAIIFDADLSYDVGEPVYGNEGESLSVSVWLDSTPLVQDLELNLGADAVTANFSLASLGIDPSTDPRSISCTATHGGQEYTDSAELVYLPENPYNGSTVKIDRRTGYLKVQYEAGEAWETVLPFGFYDSINATETESRDLTGDEPIPEPEERTERGEPIWSNHERLQVASRLNYTMVHPVPPGDSYRPNGNETAIDEYFDEAERLGLGVMYDFRHSFQNLTLVEPQVEEFRSRKGLLVWYTGDEPDGPVTPLNSTVNARNLIRSLDPYHPITLVLNCADHYWTEYAAGADILMLDPYPIAVNTAFSKRWNTPVTYDYGVPGCDGCMGSMYDISNRIDDYANRARINGKGKRGLPLWIVPQMFNDWGDEFWWRVPTGTEGAVQVVLAWNHGVTGHCAWIASSAGNDLLYNASAIATQLYAHSDFIIDGAATRRAVSTSLDYDGQNGVDVAAWTRTRDDGVQESLVLAAYLFYGSTEFELEGLPEGTVSEVLFGEVNITESGGPLFIMPRTSVAGVIIEHSQ